MNLFFLLMPILALAEPNCRSQQASEAIVVNDPTLSKSFEELQQKYQKLYDSGARLRGHAYWNAEKGTYVFPLAEGEAAIDPRFIQSITRQVEIALERGYGDFVFYPDLGHMHLLVPKLATGNEAEELASLTRSPDLKMLYHTGELLQMRTGLMSDGPLPQDPWLAWRYFSRNFVGSNDGGESLAVLFAEGAAYNTVRELPGLQEQKVVFLSGSKDGCFPFHQNGQTFYFDLSAEISAFGQSGFLPLGLR